MSTEYEKSLVEFLAKPENLHFVLEIGDHLELVKDYIFKAFWQQIQTGMQNKLTEAGMVNEWSLEMDKGDARADNLGLNLIHLPSEELKHPLRLRFRIEQWYQRINLFTIYYGVNYCSPPDSQPATESLPSFKKLIVSLRSHNYDHDEQWPGWLSAQDFDGENMFVRDFGENHQEITDNIVEQAWKAFTRYKEQIIAVNREMMGA